MQKQFNFGIIVLFALCYSIHCYSESSDSNQSDKNHRDNSQHDSSQHDRSKNPKRHQSDESDESIEIKPKNCADPNAVFSEKAPIKNCKRTCANKDKKLSEFCKSRKSKTHGCVCKNGYILNARGICIPKNFCPINCPSHEHFNTSGPPKSCQRTCSKLKILIVCPNGGPGCFCDNGYVRSSNGTCIPEYRCDNPCPGEFEVFSNTASYYEKSCDNIGIPPLFTLPPLSKCICLPGYVRANNLTCIPINDCPVRKCSKNEEFIKCGCATTCDHRNIVCNKKNCEPGCFCKKGYTRDRYNMCINELHCPDPCPGDLVYRRCSIANMCPQKCEFFNRCPIFVECTPGCYCPEGMVRLENNRCADGVQYCSNVCGRKLTTYYGCNATLVS